MKTLNFSGVLLGSLLVIACTNDETTPTEGLNTFTSQGMERSYFLKLPVDYSAESSHPLLIAFHGTGGDYTSYSLNSYYNLQGAVGEDAILVYPNARPNDNGVNQWDYDSDLLFFDDLMNRLNKTLKYDKNRLFIVGHSNGGGMSHMLGCMRGHIIRAIGPVAGALLNYQNCIGQVAVIMIQGSKDTMVQPAMVIPGRDYWISINSCNQETTEIGEDGHYCVAYQECDESFPVEYCEHDLEEPSHDYPGHAWPPFAGETIWSFFQSLPNVAPSEDGGDGPIPDKVPGTATFQISVPEDFVGVPSKLALGLYKEDFDWTKPIEVSPDHILNADIPLLVHTPGQITAYVDVDIDLSNVEFGKNYVANVVLYVEGGAYPIPTTGKDYVAFQLTTVESPVIVLETPFELTPLQSFK